MQVVVGIDEAGRGCWAGPLVAAAVRLDPDSIGGLRDSKQLSKHARQTLASLIYANAEVGLGWVYPHEIDEIGLTAATKKAMAEAMGQIKKPYDQIVIDGNYNYLPDYHDVTVLPKADSLIPAVSAASIIAKVSRDSYMRRLAGKYPEYGFEQHVGYGTARHSHLLMIHGVCSLHRLSYKPIRAVAGTL